jgi:hypothetical protein
MSRLVVVGEAFLILQFLSGGPTGRGWVASGISRASTGERGGGSWCEIVFWWFGREWRGGLRPAGTVIWELVRQWSCKGFCHRGMYFLD